MIESLTRYSTPLIFTLVIIIVTVVYYKKKRSKAEQGKLYEKQLFEAVKAGRIEVVKQIFSNYKINPNIKNQKGDPLLFVSVDDDNKIEITKFLIQQGININLTDKTGRSSLLIACHFNEYNTAKLLLENGADPNATTHLGMITNPIISSIMKQKFKITALLLSKGASILKTKELLDSRKKTKFFFQSGNWETLDPTTEKLFNEFERWESGRSQFAYFDYFLQKNKIKNKQSPYKIIQKLNPNIKYEIIKDYL